MIVLGTQLPDINVTDAMMEMGVDEVMEHRLGDDLRGLVRSIYTRMRLVELNSMNAGVPDESIKVVDK